MELINVMELVTLVVTIGMFLTGIPPCLQMYKSGDTTNVPFFLFLLSSVSCSGMVHYGFILGISTLVFLNVVGGFLNVVYSALYVWVVKEKARPCLYLSLAVAYVAALYGYLYTVLQDDASRAPVLGLSSSSITTLLMTLPAFELVGNVRNQNADGMPLVMLMGALACSVSWLIYGLMLGDPNIYTPNIPGLAVSLGKLYIIQLYGSGKAAKKNK